MNFALESKSSLWTSIKFAAAATGVVLLGSAIMRSTRRIDLTGKVVVITGGGHGLGLAIAREFVQRGSKIALAGRDGDIINKAVAELQKNGAEVFGAPCDMSLEAEVKSFFSQVRQHLGPIDLLINNAGQCFVGPAVETTASDIESALKNIFWLQYYPTMAVLPEMRARRFGRIVNVTSIGGKLPVPHQAAYTIGKYAATGWSETLAVELAKENIIVSTVTPPPLSDGAPLHVHFRGQHEKEFLWFANTLLAPVTAANAEKIARHIVNAARYGDRERATSLRSWFPIRAFGLAPNITTMMLEQVDRWLPLPAKSSVRNGREIVENSSDPTIQALGEKLRAAEERYMPQPVVDG